MMSSVINALQLDQKPIKGQFITIEENDTTDGTFIISSILDHQIKNGYKIILVLFHNSFGHYHAIGQKFGYNLLALKESGNLIIFDILESMKPSNSETSFVNSNSSDLLRNLTLDVKAQAVNLSKSSNVCLIVDHVSNLLLLDYKLDVVEVFVHCMKSILQESENLGAVILVHKIKRSKDFMNFMNFMKHLSSTVVVISDLETGKAIDVTGMMKVECKWKSMWSKQSEYHYQLLDRNIKVFAPGLKI